ncbi:dUTP diphosphatase [Brevibacillus humidisoli]|uniref:dUTP diphosphatase n=1 Tax=Brevibacillus humidisoli TaxID=2895522 RepID=UPI001E3F853B|nr:dUTP diphosphatase [Brevibacillus humidisoli]UFJ42179.1 dUTP diphosphatase [Brevibacillus humidisoli]
MTLHVKIKPLSPLIGSELPLPRYATPGSAGLDLAACIDQEIVIEPGQRAKVPTGLAFQMPDAGVVGLVFPRSGNAWKYGVSLTNCVGVIDSDYTGEIQVILQNLDSEQPFVVKRGDRIAQLVFVPVFQAQLTVVDELTETKRGAGGFGSTGTI